MTTDDKQLPTREEFRAVWGNRDGLARLLGRAVRVLEAGEVPERSDLLWHLVAVHGRADVESMSLDEAQHWHEHDHHSGRFKHPVDDLHWTAVLAAAHLRIYLTRLDPASSVPETPLFSAQRAAMRRHGVPEPTATRAAAIAASALRPIEFPASKAHPRAIYDSQLYIHLTCRNVEWWSEEGSGPINEQGCDACDCAPDGMWRRVYILPDGDPQ